MAANWSVLPQKILHLILQRISLPDFSNFGRVCSSWRLAYLGRRGLSSPPPCLLLFEPMNPGLRPRLWSLHGDKLMRFSSPKPDILRVEVLLGSSNGWLVVVPSTGPGLHLRNPTSNERIALPSVASDGLEIAFNIDDTRYYRVYHVALSSALTSAGSVVVARLSNEIYGHHLAWCRTGEQEWALFGESPLPSPLRQYYLDNHRGRVRCVGIRADYHDMLLHNSKLYALGDHGDLVIYDFNPQPKIIYRSSIFNISNNVISNNNREYNNRFVECSGELFLISCENDSDSDNDVNNHNIHIFKEVEGQDGGWAEVKSLGDWVLLLGRRRAESYCTKSMFGSCFEANCIYYHLKRSERRYLGKFSMTDGSKKIIPHPPTSCYPGEWICAQTW